MPPNSTSRAIVSAGEKPVVARRFSEIVILYFPSGSKSPSSLIVDPEGRSFRFATCGVSEILDASALSTARRWLKLSMIAGSARASCNVKASMRSREAVLPRGKLLRCGIGVRRRQYQQFVLQGVPQQAARRVQIPVQGQVGRPGRGVSLGRVAEPLSQNVHGFRGPENRLPGPHPQSGCRS